MTSSAIVQVGLRLETSCKCVLMSNSKTKVTIIKGPSVNIYPMRQSAKPCEQSIFLRSLKRKPKRCWTLAFCCTGTCMAKVGMLTKRQGVVESYELIRDEKD